jgi:hypothetical protein
VSGAARPLQPRPATPGAGVTCTPSLALLTCALDSGSHERQVSSCRTTVLFVVSMFFLSFLSAVGIVVLGLFLLSS